ncbi:MAG: aspartate ammonia-lyase [Planctomycetota bacterium]|nr:aspartate ammonia-lyase [Planctomycetota bacterium]
MSSTRTEKDMLGEVSVPENALWGIHTHRAVENFGEAVRPVPSAMIRAYGYVKLACASVNRELGKLDEDVAAALIQACEEMAAGELDEHIIVECLQGGAGTSLNMNVNEVLANRALQLIGERPGNYSRIDPFDHVNLHQSTNDTYPTALKVAALFELTRLEDTVTALLESFQDAEKKFASLGKVGRTQFQDAVPVTLGREMGAYAEAFARDRWRIFKCRERIRTVNLGGTAIGTGITAPRRYVFRVTDKLRELTSLPVARAENLVDATQNLDQFVEVSGILKALAADLIKISNDLRLLASGPRAGLAELRLPTRQEGSSIMPGKVNPVMPEFAAQAGMAVYGFDGMLSHAVAMGSLELNAFVPLVSWSLLSSIDLLARACDGLCTRCVVGIEANEEVLSRTLRSSTAAAVMLVSVLGHEKASQIARAAVERGQPLEHAVLESELLSKEEWEMLIQPQRLNSLGEPPKP